jgi:hypothetical protein
MPDKISIQNISPKTLLPDFRLAIFFFRVENQTFLDNNSWLDL